MKRVTLDDELIIDVMAGTPLRNMKKYYECDLRGVGISEAKNESYYLVIYFFILFFTINDLIILFLFFN